jgi:hypothetical protein
MRTSEWIQIGFAVILAAAAWIQPLFFNHCPCAGAGTSRCWRWSLCCRDAGARDRSFPAPALRFHPARLAYGRSLPGALLADRAILSGSEPSHRAAPDGVRPLADAADGRNLRHIPHRPRLVLEVAYLFCYPLVPLGLLASTPAANAPRGQFLAGGPGRDLSLLRNHAVCARLPSPGPCRQPSPGANGQGADLQSLDSQAWQHPCHFVSQRPRGFLPSPSRWCCCVLCPMAGLVFLFISVWISLGAVVGRYHYALDVLLGAAPPWASFSPVTGISLDPEDLHRHTGHHLLRRAGRTAIGRG